jgi:hypothetical protein
MVLQVYIESDEAGVIYNTSDTTLLSVIGRFSLPLQSVVEKLCVTISQTEVLHHEQLIATI